MPSIQIDMFEVQLGAAVLLQFATQDGPVRVLADAGVKAGGYSADHVLKKLKPILGDRPHIDLVIGTHYDEDHLNGLVPIIDDPDISIGEAWMPPVANDTQNFAVDRSLALSDLLPAQFGGDGGEAALEAYLAAKRLDIEALGEIETQLDPESRAGFKRIALNYRERYGNGVPLDISFFRAQLADGQHDGQEIDHGCDQEVEPDPLVEELSNNLRRSYDYPWYLDTDHMLDSLKSAAADSRDGIQYLVAPRIASLVNLRRAAAKDAINAKALFEVLKALERKGVGVRYEMIEDGTPKRFRWVPTSQRFILSRPDSEGLTFDMLGPSKSLIKKHRDRLPVLEASKVALAFRGEIKSITPSNQLSYIGCFRHESQVMLISGDAGCVDFAERRGVYYPKLLAAMSPLHVIQVAHHGGNNAHFYRVLAAAAFPEQTEQSFMLLSHGWHDKSRPSEVFHDFLMTTLKEGDDVRLLFTSEPTRDKVIDYLSAINPVVGTAGKVGDIRLSFDGTWKVKAHAITIA